MLMAVSPTASSSGRAKVSVSASASRVGVAATGERKYQRRAKVSVCSELLLSIYACRCGKGAIIVAM